MSAHTPGPWEVFWIASPRAMSARICSGNFDIAHLPKEWNGRTGGADARLIAAAPDLLEALHRVRAAFEEPKADTEAERNAINAAYKHACWAIAKAEGKS